MADDTTEAAPLSSEEAASMDALADGLRDAMQIEQVNANYVSSFATLAASMFLITLHTDDKQATSHQLL